MEDNKDNQKDKNDVEMDDNAIDDGMEKNNNMDVQDVYGVDSGLGENAPMRDEQQANTEEKEEKNVNDQEWQQWSQQRKVKKDENTDNLQPMQRDPQNGEWQPIEQMKKAPPKQNESNKKPERRKEEDKSNPFRSLGDALSQWKQRLNIIEQDNSAREEMEIQTQTKNNDEDAEMQDQEQDKNLDDEADGYAHVPEEMKNKKDYKEAMCDAREEDLANRMDFKREEEANDGDSQIDNNRTELTKLEVELCRQNF